MNYCLEVLLKVVTIKLSRFALPVLAFGSIYAGDVLAQNPSLPFSPNPSSYTRYLNSLSWRSGRKLHFFGLSGCEITQYGYYGCRSAYVKITDPLGSKKCEIMKAGEWNYPREYSIVTEKLSGRWKNDMGDFACSN